jgi:hypothetical protein
MTAAEGQSSESPLDTIVEFVAAADPRAAIGAVRDVVRSVATTRLLQRQMAKALASRPEVLHDGVPPAPQAVGELLLALRRAGVAVVAAPICGVCARALPSIRGSAWRCATCRQPRRQCANCGQWRRPSARDEHGRWQCRRCRPATEPDWNLFVDAVHAIVAAASRDLVLQAAHRAAPQLAQRRALASAVTGNPDLLRGRGAESPTRAVFRFIDLLLDAGVTGVVRPVCPRCALWPRGRARQVCRWDTNLWPLRPAGSGYGLRAVRPRPPGRCA